MLFWMSDRGTRHIQEKKDCEDCIGAAVEENRVVLALADGVSTCKKAAKGAKIAVHTLLDLLMDLDLTRPAGLQRQKIFEKVWNAHRLEAEKTGCSVEDYSCIYAALRYDRDTDRLFYLSLGDAMILAMGEETDRGLLAMPASKQNGTPASTTVHGERLLQIGHVCGKPYTSILLCSDGAWSLLYDRNRMKTEARKLIESENFEGITGYLKKGNGVDDCSFLALQLENWIRPSNIRPAGQHAGLCRYENAGPNAAAYPGPENRIERILVRRSPESPVFADFSGETIAKAGTWRLQADGAVSYSPFERKQKPESRRIRRTILLQGEGSMPL